MSTTPAPLTPAELDAMRLIAMREQTEAIKANTAAMTAQAEAAQALIAAIATMKLGISDDLFKWTLQLVVDAMKNKLAV